VNILRELRHPYIVRYYDRIIDKASTRIYIVMEYCEGGDLGRVIKRCRREKTYLDEAFIWKCFSQMVLAIKDCHRHKEPVPASSGGAGGSSSSAAAERVKPILHRDLKPGNIFLDSSRNIKIGDFGLAKELASESKYAVTNVGTPFYMSPEQINEQHYNEKSDICEKPCCALPGSLRDARSCRQTCLAGLPRHNGPLRPPSPRNSHPFPFDLQGLSGACFTSCARLCRPLRPPTTFPLPSRSTLASSPASRRSTATTSTAQCAG